MSGNSEVEELLAQVQAEEAAELGEGQEELPVAGGPEDADDDAAGYGESDDDGDEGELPGADDDEGQEEEGEFDEEPEGEEPEGDEEDDPETEEANSEVPTPMEARITQLEHELRLARQERIEERRAAEARRQDQLREQRARPAVDPEIVKATRIALFGGPAASEQLQKLSPEAARIGIERAREANEMAVLQVTDPEAFYHKYLGPTVNAHISARTQEFRQASQRRVEDAAVDKHRSYLSKPGVLDRVSAIMSSGRVAGSFAEKLSTAVELDLARHGSVGRAKKDQRSKARDRDAAAKTSAKRRRGRGRRRGGGRPKAPEHDMNNVMDDVAYLQEQERLGLLRDE